MLAEPESAVTAIAGGSASPRSPSPVRSPISPAMTRNIMLVEGAGFTLEFEVGSRASAWTRLYEPFAFDGGWKTHCTLIDGPISDFNSDRCA